MTREEIVLEKLNNNRFLGSKPIKFREYNSELDEYTVSNLKAIEHVADRVYEILALSKIYNTYHLTNRYQCPGGANRSTVDIWRIYKYYYGDVDIFTIMRALYKLVNDEKLLGTYRCPTVRKRVFWLDNSIVAFRDYGSYAELGVPFKEWESIGL